MIQTDLMQEEKETSCPPKIYVSNEEAALLKSMRDLRERSQRLKDDLDGAEDDQRHEIEKRLAEARTEWQELSEMREKAYVRKMISLGHLPPEADAES